MRWTFILVGTYNICIIIANIIGGTYIQGVGQLMLLFLFSYTVKKIAFLLYQHLYRNNSFSEIFSKSLCYVTKFDTCLLIIIYIITFFQCIYKLMMIILEIRIISYVAIFIFFLPCLQFIQRGIFIYNILLLFALNDAVCIMISNKS